MTFQSHTLSGPPLLTPPTTPQDDVRRALPHAVGPEKSILSSMLQDPQEFIGRAIEEKLTAEHFYLPAHSTLFSFLLELFAAGIEIELVSLVQQMLDRGLLDRVGGPSTVTDLYTYAPGNGHFSYHLQHVKDKFVLRSIILNSNEAIAQAYDSPDEVATLLDDVERKVMAIRDSAASDRVPTVKDSVHRVIDNFQRLIAGQKDSRGILTGFEELDRMTGGLKPGNMFVVGARPSMGKTSFMMNIVEHACFHEGIPTLVFSAEMERDEIINRLLFSRAKFATSQVSRGVNPDKGDLQRIKRVALEIAASKLYVIDTSGPSINYIRAAARRHKREHQIGLIAIDYLQLLKSTSKQAQNSREREIAEISAGVKGLAKDLGIPIIILAQLNRDAEKRGTAKAHGKPRMSDLRDSGSIEQDADIVGLLYREAYYADDEEAKDASAGRAQIDIAKNRNGGTGTIPLTFIGELMRFETGPPAQEQSDMFTPQKPKSRHEY
jgi:replicative DNA helicase